MKIFRLLIILPLLLAVFGGCSQFQAKISSQPMSQIRLTLDPESSVETAQVYLDSQSRGTIRRGQTRSYSLHASSNVTLRLVGQGVTVERNLRLRPGSQIDLKIPLLAAGKSKGSLVVTHSRKSELGSASLVINDQTRGNLAHGASQSLELEPGEYQVQLKGGLFESEKVKISIQSGKSQTIELTPGRPNGKVRLTYSGESAHPWAEIWVDGKKSDRIQRGRTKVLELATGTHSIEVRAQDDRTSHSLQVVKDREQALTLKLESKVARLALTFKSSSNIKEASVEIDGKSHGRIKSGQTLYYNELKPGRSTVAVKHGNLSDQKTVNLSRRKTTNLELELREASGTLEIVHLGDSKAPFTRVLIDGTYRFTINRGQSRSLDLPAGNYTLRFEGGRSPQTIRQIVENGKTSRVAIKL